LQTDNISFTISDNVYWFSQATTYPVMVKVRDGGERVRGASLVFRDDLRDILARLPDDNAREQVLACITDPANRLRVHQGMLLVCLNVLGYPRGYDASRWWERHRAVFIREPDPEKAVAVVLGWTESAERLVDQNPDLADVGEISGQARSARYQQWGVWGGDRDFGEMFSAFVERKHPDGNVPENPNVVWWQRVWWQQK
jgi:hypothetical protein